MTDKSDTDERESESEHTGFKVVDRRRFSHEGDTLSGMASATEQTESSRVISSARLDEPVLERGAMESAKSKNAATADRDGDSQVESSERHFAPVNFSGFLVGLAHQAMVMLGEVPNPHTGEAMQDIAAARETIDLLGLLEEKTKGNLTSEESRLLTEVLATLRMRFVERTSQPR